VAWRRLEGRRKSDHARHRIHRPGIWATVISHGFGVIEFVLVPNQLALVRQRSSGSGESYSCSWLKEASRLSIPRTARPAFDEAASCTSPTICRASTSAPQPLVPEEEYGSTGQRFAGSLRICRRYSSSPLSDPPRVDFEIARHLLLRTPLSSWYGYAIDGDLRSAQSRRHSPASVPDAEEEARSCLQPGRPIDRVALRVGRALPIGSVQAERTP